MHAVKLHAVWQLQLLSDRPWGRGQGKDFAGCASCVVLECCKQIMLALTRQTLQLLALAKATIPAAKRVDAELPPAVAANSSCASQQPTANKNAH